MRWLMWTDVRGKGFVRWWCRMFPPIVALPCSHSATWQALCFFLSGETYAQTFVSKTHGGEQCMRTIDFPLV